MPQNDSERIKRKRGNYEGPFVLGSQKVSRRRTAKTLLFRKRTPSRYRSRQVARGFVGALGDAKFVDATITQAAVNTTGTIQHVSIIAQGNTVNNRVGKACRARTARLRAVIKADSTAQLNTVRCLLVWDYQPNKALAAITDIIDAVTVQAQPNRENNLRFKIIRDWWYVLTGNGNLATPNTEVLLDSYVKLPKDANILYTSADTTGVIGDVIQGALLFITLGDVAAGTADAALTGTCRVNFDEYTTGIRRGSSRMVM